MRNKRGAWSLGAAIIAALFALVLGGCGGKDEASPGITDATYTLVVERNVAYVADTGRPGCYKRVETYSVMRDHEMLNQVTFDAHGNPHYVERSYATGHGATLKGALNDYEAQNPHGY